MDSAGQEGDKSFAAIASALARRTGAFDDTDTLINAVGDVRASSHSKTNRTSSGSSETEKPAESAMLMTYQKRKLGPHGGVRIRDGDPPPPIGADGSSILLSTIDYTELISTCFFGWTQA